MGNYYKVSYQSKTMPYAKSKVVEAKNMAAAKRKVKATLDFGEVRGKYEVAAERTYRP